MPFKTSLARIVLAFGIVIVPALPAAWAQTAATAPASKAAPSAAPAAKKVAEPLIDINSASTADLVALKGVGEKRADAIVKGRPYKGKDELVQKKIISKGVYEGIKDKIIAKQK